jgi:hypothetical protein
VRGVLAAVLVAAVLAGGAAGAQTRATLRVVALSPVAVHGAGFHAGERVHVWVTLGGTNSVRVVRTTAAGAFTATFAAAPAYDPCNALLIARATGALGDAAVLKLPERACPASP